MKKYIPFEIKIVFLEEEDVVRTSKGGLNGEDGLGGDKPVDFGENEW